MSFCKISFSSYSASREARALAVVAAEALEIKQFDRAPLFLYLMSCHNRIENAMACAYKKF